jgi:uncharacterized membrane protein SpoIIM required for sporulation
VGRGTGDLVFVFEFFQFFHHNRIYFPLWVFAGIMASIFVCHVYLPNGLWLVYKN